MSVSEDFVEGETRPCKCAHPDCKCQAETEEKYCCERCCQIATTPEMICACGHPQCGGPLK